MKQWLLVFVVLVLVGLGMTADLHAGLFRRGGWTWPIARKVLGRCRGCDTAAACGVTCRGGQCDAGTCAPASSEPPVGGRGIQPPPPVR